MKIKISNIIKMCKISNRVQLQINPQDGTIVLLVYPVGGIKSKVVVLMAIPVYDHERLTFLVDSPSLSAFFPELTVNGAFLQLHLHATTVWAQKLTCKFIHAYIWGESIYTCITYKITSYHSLLLMRPFLISYNYNILCKIKIV